MADKSTLTHIPSHLRALCRNLISFGYRRRGARNMSWFWLMLAIAMGGLTTTAMADNADTGLVHMQLNRPTASTSELELDFDGTPDYKYFTLDNPARVVIDIQHADLKTKPGNFSWVQTPITKMRIGHQDNGALRIVLDLVVPSKMQVEQMNSSLEHVVLIDLTNPPPGTVAPSQQNTASTSYTLGNIALSQGSGMATKDTSHTQTATVKPTTAPVAASNAPKPSPIAPPMNNESKALPPRPVITEASVNTKHTVVVVIDPGHGGKDPGAAGPEDEHEKDVVLAISEQLYQILNKEPGIHAVMTRNGDYYLSLRERLDVARDAHADVFIAIHADAYDNPYSHGASVYALSLKGASSEAARWLAAKENYSELGGVNLNGKGDMLRSVLIDLSQTATISSSLLLGQAILQDLGQLGALHHGDKVEQAPFVVLKSPDIPSVLVETGFISNPDEAKRLENSAYDQAVALAIAAGLNHYFKESPPVAA